MIPAAIVRNWALKLLAVGVAVVVWFFVVNADRSLIGFVVPVEYVGLDAGLVVLGTPRETADVQVEAARWSGARLAASDIRVRVDLSRAREGDNTLQVSAGDVLAPAGVTVVRISPSAVRVSVAAAATRALRVVPQLRGSPPPDVRVGRVVVEPSTVQVTGPRTTIEERATVETAPVDVTNLRQSITRTVGLLLPEAVSPMSQRTVQVTVEVRRDQ